MRGGRAALVLAMAVTAVWAPLRRAVAGTPVIAASTEEAGARGLVYTMVNFPPPVDFGLQGFGCGFVDLDGDGDNDIVIVGAPDGHVGVFENDGTGHFTDRSAGNGIPALASPSGIVAADYDGDGDLDLYLTQMGEANVLAANLGGFQFVDVAAAAGVGDPGAGTGASFGDYDGDTWLDLYVCNYNDAVPGTADLDNKLYRNAGDGTFEDVSVAQGVDDIGYGFQCVWLDYDLDGDPDLYLSNDRGHQYEPNRLWRNDAGVLTDVSGPSGAGIGLYSMGVACGDFDHNGWPDLYMTNVPGGGGYDNPLLLNQGDGTFTESSVDAGVENGSAGTSWGTCFLDFDNNGFLDLYVNNQFADNALYVSDGEFRCSEAGAAAALGGEGVSYGSSMGDVDGDGDLDLLVNDLGWNPPNLNVLLYINHEGETRNWIRCRMVGEDHNVWAVGGGVKTRTGTHWQFQEIRAGANGYLGQNELVAHFGLGAATAADEVVATWPDRAAQRTLTDLPSGETWTLYPPARLGDDDGDGTVTLFDFFAFSDCYLAGFGPGCEMMDFDGDSDLDPDDIAGFLARYSGPIHDCDDSGEADLIEIVLDPGLDADWTGIPDACELAGDLNGDGVVGVDDFLALLAAWGPCPKPPAPCPADHDASGSVGVDDFLSLLANWG